MAHLLPIAIEGATTHAPMSSEAIIEIMLSILGCMIGILALLLGAFAFFGYQALKDEAIKAARATATTEAQRYFDAQYAKEQAVDLLLANKDSGNDISGIPDHQ